MSPREIARLCYKVLAIYAVIVAIGNVNQVMWILSMPFGSGSGRSLWQQAVSILTASTPVMQFALALWIWHKAGVLAAWTFGYDIQDEPDEPDSVPIAMSADLVQAIAFSCLGIWVLVSALPEAMTMLAWYAFEVERVPGEPDEFANRRMMAAVIGVLVRLALGCWLLFGSAGLIRILKRFRDAGLDDTAPPPPPKASK